MRLYAEDFNHQRIVFENCVTHYLYIETHEPLDRRCLEKIYAKHFRKLYKNHKVSLFLSLKMFYHLSQVLGEQLEDLLLSYYNDMVVPLSIILPGLKAKEFEEMTLLVSLVEELKDVLAGRKRGNTFQLGKYDANSNVKHIFVTKTFSIFNSHSSFLKFNKIWPETELVLKQIENQVRANSENNSLIILTLEREEEDQVQNSFKNSLPIESGLFE